MASPTLQQWAQLAAALGVGGFLKAVFDWLREDRQAAKKQPAELVEAAARFQGAVTEGGEDLITWLRSELKFLRGQVLELRDEVSTARSEAASAKREATEAKSDHARCEGLLTEFRAQLDKVMAEPVAPDYAPTLLHGVIPPKT